ncbi:GNAT family N-acetyltransferase [Pseudalkalibacillus caeni]|nr:GNAT family N-acetyltransferase [Pseudalkalibacillus caeni]
MDLHMRRLGLGDAEQFRQMETGIENDYVVRIFDKLVQEDLLYGAFYENELIGIAGITVYEIQYAILGRLRTRVHDRGKGVARKLFRFLVSQLRQNPHIKWIGYATEESNIPANSIASHLSMDCIAKIYSSKLNRTGSGHFASLDSDTDDWQEIKGCKEKKLLFKQAMEESGMNFFPYAVYYPLPAYPEDISDDYLSGCRMWARNGRFFCLMPEEKGESYFHLKYFWNDIFEQTGLWKKAIRLAEREDRVIWFDMSESMFRSLPEKQWFETTAWHLIGEPLKEEKIDEVDCV